MAELSSFLVRPLVVMLRDSQDVSGPGYTLHDVLHGMSNNKQVGPTYGVPSCLSAPCTAVMQVPLASLSVTVTQHVFVVARQC